MVFVEGESDRIALETLAQGLGLDLGAAGVSIVSTGGATAIRRLVADAVMDVGTGTRLCGLLDEAEVSDVTKGLEWAGFGSNLSADDLDRLGFFVCRRDLEDELIRAAGTDLTLDVIASEGEYPSLLRLQRQPAWRSRPVHDQLRRFMSSQSGRKARYARALVEAVDTTRAPAPLTRLLRHAVGDEQA